MSARPHPPHPAALVPVAALALAVFVMVALIPQLWNDGDTGWHLVAGRLIFADAAVPVTDPFSYTFAGKPWLAHEWLAELLMAGSFALGSYSLLALLFAAAIAALVLILGLEIGRWLQPAQTVIVLLLVLIALAPFMLARPHVLAWPLLAGWVVILLRAREQDRPPRLAAALLMLVWANLHASFIFGLAVAGLFGLEALFAARDRSRAFLGWLGFGLVALLAALATPFGIHGLLFPLQVSGMAAISGVSEWRPTVVAQERGFQLVLIASIFALLYRGVRVPLLRLALLCLTLYLAFQAVRHQAVLAIVGSLLLARPLAETFAAAPPSSARAPNRTIAAALAVALLLFTAGRLAVPVVPPANASNPVAIIAALPPALRRQPVLNGYGFGGPLILAGIRPYIDGRVDMYGDAFTFEHDRMMAGDLAAFDRAVARWHIAWTILPPGAPLVAALDKHPGWKRLAADRWAVVHVRTDPAPAI